MMTDASNPEENGRFNLRGHRASTRLAKGSRVQAASGITPHLHSSMTEKMPHSISPESTPVDGSSREMSQAESSKQEPETQDATMEDAPSPPAPAPAEKSKVNLEELFDDDSDGEFASSAPIKDEEDASQPAPM